MGSLLGKGGSSAPAAPDYAALQAQQLANNKKLIEEQTRANRPDQIGPQGSSKWTQDANGNWTQTIDAGDAGKNYQEQQGGLLRMSQGATGMLPGAIADASKGLDTSGLPAWRGYDMDPTGNSKSIQDATYSLLKPQRDIARNQEIQRLKNQGISEDSEAFRSSMHNLDAGDTDAQLKSLIAGQSEYGNAFARNTQGTTLSNALRGLKLGEQSNVNNYGLGQVKSLYGIGTPGGNNAQFSNPVFGQFATAGRAEDHSYDAATDAYKAQMDQYNADQASQGDMLGGIGGLIGAGASFFVPGGQTGQLAGLGASLGKGLGKGLGKR